MHKPKWTLLKLEKETIIYNSNGSIYHTIPANQKVLLDVSQSGKLWNRFKKHIIMRDKKCVECGNNQRLTAHHIIPVSIAPEKAYDEVNLQTLCAECHRKKHPNKHISVPIR